MNRRSMSLVAALALALALTPAVALAAPGTEGGQPDVGVAVQDNTLSTVYLDPQNGSDDNDGSSSNPIKSLEKALSLVAADGAIEVLGSVDIAQDTTITDATFKRASGYEGTLFDVTGGTLTLANVTIDGQNQKASGYLVEVNGSSSSLVITGTTRLVNNGASATSGQGNSAVYITGGGSLTMNDGEISGNRSSSAGGGIEGYLVGTIQLNGGTIKNNSSARSGGGVSILGSGKLVLAGTEISGNSASVSAGGIYLQAYSDKITFEMSSGSIMNNTSGNLGAAISTVYYPEKGNDIAMFISGGTISGNGKTAGEANPDAILVVGQDESDTEGSTLTLSDSPTLTDGIYINNDSSAFNYDALTVDGSFSPTSPVALGVNQAPGSTPFNVIAYTNGATPDASQFVSYNEASYVFTATETHLQAAKTIKVYFKSTDGTTTYATICVARGVPIDTALIPTDFEGPVGYDLVAWTRYRPSGIWDFSDPTPNSSTLDLRATWALSAPAVEVAGETTVHVGTNIELAAVAEHPLDGVAYSYQWYRDGEKIDGQQGRTLTVTEPGSYAVEVTARAGADVADAVTSEPVACAFEDHVPEDGWTTSSSSHWHECEVCGANLVEGKHTTDDEWHTDGSSHWHECTTCGARLDVTAHETDAKWHSDGASHWRECVTCGAKLGAEKHAAGDEWSHDEVQHWRECAACGERVGAEAHDWGEWVVTDGATATESGSRERECATCGLEQVEEILPGGVETLRMMRFYNPWTGEHLYTASDDEAAALVSQGWEAEGLGWLAPSASGSPVYRLYNPWVAGGDHHYTPSAAERDALVAAGWRYEGVGWYSAEGEGAVSLLRLYNPYATTGTHHYTASAEERDALVEAGWAFEGEAWRGLAG